MAVRNLSPLLKTDWKYFEKPIAEFSRSDWTVLNAQRREYYENQQVEQLLRMLKVMENDPAFGYPINTYQHCLQSATRVYQAGFEPETVVVALFHDIGFVVSPENHGEFAAALLKPYISEKNYWMLKHHGDFQAYYCHDHPTVPDRLVRERWKDHPYYDWAVEFVGSYDQNAMDPNYDTLPLSFFEPIVHQVVKPSNLETDRSSV